MAKYEILQFPKGAPYDIQAVLENKQKTLLGVNYELNDHRIILYEERYDLIFINNETKDLFWINLSGTLIME